MSQNYLLGIDVGTLGCRCSIFDRLGNVKGYAYEEYSIESPKPNYAEQNPETYWKATTNTIKQTIRKSKIAGKDVIAIGLTGIQVSIVLINSKGRCLGPSIIYADKRSMKQYEWMRNEIGEKEVYEITGCRLDPMYPASKLRWIKENQPKKFKNIFKILSPKDYIGFKLTGQTKMDIAMASTMQLLDIKKGTWSKNLAEILEIPLEILPELLSSAEILGEIGPKIAERVGLKKDTPIIIGGGDTTCMALGAGILTEELVCSSLGTTSNMFGCLNQLKLDSKMRVSFYRHVVPGNWVVVAGTTDSLALRWYRDNLGHFETEIGKKMGVNPYKVIDQEAEKSKAGANGVIFLPFLTGARSPLWNPNATGVLFGLRYYHKKEDIARSLLESVAYSIRHRMEVMGELGLDPKEIRVVGGGAKSRLWTQIIADVTGVAISRLKNEEAGVLGASILAGIAVGVYKNFDEACRDAIKVSTRQFPQIENKRPYEAAFKMYKILYRDLLEAFEKRASLSKNY